MAQAKRFRIVYHSRLKSHLSALDRKYHSLIRQTIDAQLSNEPEVETRNRKPVIQPFPFEATWEIRFGPQNCFRVFYEVDRVESSVSVLAIGEKKGNRLFIGGEEVML
jgi:mRNA-degrading endonuclease RelE of RelBE toxin-antitoxin system